MEETLALPYAPTLRRFIAFVIDFLILEVLFIIANLFIFLFSRVLPEALLATLAFLVWIPLSWIYFAWGESSKHSATWGKRLMGIKVVDKDGQRITFMRASGRYFGKALSAVLLWVGFLMIPFSKRKQGLHDKMASTFVIRKV